MCIRDSYRLIQIEAERRGLTTEEWLDATLHLHTAMPVSYTHLDVYKRQIIICRHVIIICYHLLITNYIPGRQREKRPVSYTHLPA